MDDQPFEAIPATAANQAESDQYHAETMTHLRGAKAYICSFLMPDGTFVYSVGGTTTPRVKELFFSATAFRLSKNLDAIMADQRRKLAEAEGDDPAYD